MQPGYRGLRDAAAWFDISERTRIRLTGEDRLRLLHALATNVIEGLEPGQSTKTFFLTPQGRIVALCRVYAAADSVLLETESACRESLLDYLDRHIIMDDVIVSDETASTRAVAVEGPGAAALAAGLSEYGSLHHDALVGPTGFWIELSTERHSQLVDRLIAAGVPQADDQDQLAARVENKIPSYGIDYGERNIPHETQLLDIVSFTKGCYVGQEIVERVSAQGQVNRLLTPIQTEAVAIPAELRVLYGEQTAGELTSAIVSPQTGTVAGFAVLRREALAADADLRLAGDAVHIPAWP